jgi:hypothetical protein
MACITLIISIKSTMPMTISMGLIAIGMLLIPLILSTFVELFVEFAHEVCHHFKYEQYYIKRIHIVDGNTQSVPHMITDQDYACYTVCPTVWDNIQLELADIQPGDEFTINYNIKHEIMHITSHISWAYLAPIPNKLI